MDKVQEDLTNIKEKLIEQIKGQYDEAQANEFISKINEMNDEQFIEFLKQQGMIAGDGSPNQQCVFCQMVAGQIPTTKIAENDSGIAILEINPVSEGHTLIIPKKHVGKNTQLDDEFLKLSELVTKKLTNTFNPTKVDLIPNEVMGHQVINALPVYNGETLNSPRQNQTPEGLTTLKEKIDSSDVEEITLPDKVEQEPEPEKEEEISDENTWLPKRIP
jgi:histidine triad (HIT) family protein